MIYFISFVLIFFSLSGCHHLKARHDKVGPPSLNRADSPLSPLEVDVPPNETMAQSNARTIPPSDKSLPQTSPPNEILLNEPIEMPDQKPTQEGMTIVLKKDGQEIEAKKSSKIDPTLSMSTPPKIQHEPTKITSANIHPKPYEVAVGEVPLLEDQDFERAKSQVARTPGPVSGETALLWMKNGNKRFRKGLFRKDGASLKDIQRGFRGKSQPHSVVLGCSDSRVPPEIIFDQKIGEIEVFRQFGIQLDEATVQGLENAIQNHGVNLLVLLGHPQCQRIDALTANNASHSRQPSNKNQKTVRAAKSEFNQLHLIAQELQQKSQIIQEAVANGTLLVEPAVYQLENGMVEFKER